jgi:hypothetical protein
MKSVISTLALLAVAAPAYASTIPVPEPGGIGLVGGVIGALIALKVLGRK